MSSREPWTELGISRATYFRRRREARGLPAMGPPTQSVFVPADGHHAANGNGNGNGNGHRRRAGPAVLDTNGGPPPPPSPPPEAPPSSGNALADLNTVIRGLMRDPHLHAGVNPSPADRDKRRAALRDLRLATGPMRDLTAAYATARALGQSEANIRALVDLALQHVPDADRAEALRLAEAIDAESTLS